VSHLRTGIVMSAGGGVLKRQLPLFRYGLGGKLSNGQQVMSAISLVDEVRAILWSIDHQIEGPINLAALDVTNAAFTSALARALRRPALAPVRPSHYDWSWGLNSRPARYCEPERRGAGPARERLHLQPIGPTFDHRKRPSRA